MFHAHKLDELEEIVEMPGTLVHEHVAALLKCRIKRKTTHSERVKIYKRIEMYNTLLANRI